MLFAWVKIISSTSKPSANSCSPSTTSSDDKSLEAAAETLADRREFRLSARQYDAFVAALDAPPKPRPRLEKLLTTTSVLE